MEDYLDQGPLQRWLESQEAGTSTDPHPQMSSKNFGTNQTIPQMSANSFGTNQTVPQMSSKSFGTNQTVPQMSSNSFRTNQTVLQMSSNSFGTNQTVPQMSSNSFGTNQTVPQMSSNSFGTNQTAQHISSNSFGTNESIAGTSQLTVQPSATLHGSLQGVAAAPTSDSESDTDNEDVEGEKEEQGKPEAMTSLVVRACASAYDHCMSAYEIYQFVMCNTKFGEYKKLDQKWRKNVRHILSEKSYLIRTDRKAAIGKGNMWQFDVDEYESIKAESLPVSKGKTLAKNATMVCLLFN